MSQTVIKKSTNRPLGNSLIVEKYGKVARQLLFKLKAQEQLKVAEKEFETAEAELQTTLDNGKEEQRHYDLMVKLKDHIGETQLRTEVMKKIVQNMNSNEISSTEKAFYILKHKSLIDIKEV